MLKQRNEKRCNKRMVAKFEVCNVDFSLVLKYNILR